MLSINVLPLSATQRLMYHNIRYLSSSAAYNKYRTRPPYKTVDQLLYPVHTSYKIHPEKALYKLLYRQKKENPFFARPPVGRPSINMETAVASIHSSRVCSSKRVKSLNKLFMRYIPELLVTSEFGLPLIEHDIQFSGIKVGPYYDTVKMYWIPKGTEEDEIIQQLLNKVAFPLRSELINLRVMGLVPPIHFLKDKRHAFILEMERRFRIADYGEDYVPSFINENSLKKDLRLEIQLPRELREKITSTDEKIEITEQEERGLPPMVTNTLGLNHKNILDSILESRKKVRVYSQSTESLIGESIVKKVPFNYESQPMQSWDRKAFDEYMKSQKSKRKQILRVRNRELSDEIRQASRRVYQDDEEVDNSEYTEFVQNAFPDVVESFDDDCKLKFEQ